MIVEKIWPFRDLYLPRSLSALTLKYMEDGQKIFISERRRFSKWIAVRIWKHMIKRTLCHLIVTIGRMWCIVGWTSTCSRNSGSRFCRWSKGRIGRWGSSSRRRKANEIYKYYEYLSTNELVIVGCRSVEWCWQFYKDVWLSNRILGCFIGCLRLLLCYVEFE